MELKKICSYFHDIHNGDNPYNNADCLILIIWKMKNFDNDYNTGYNNLMMLLILIILVIL